jgi:hypothetical protein
LIESFGVDSLQNAANRRLTRRRATQTEPDTHRRSQITSPSAMVVNVRAPASPAQTPIARTVTNPCRHRGSSTEAYTASRSPGTGSEPAHPCSDQCAATEIGKDSQADTAMAPVIVLA